MNQNDERTAVHGRKIQRSGEHYANTRSPKPVQRRHMNPNGIRRRHQNKQKARRRFTAMIRTVIALLLAAVVIVSVLLLTPICDIRYVTVEGNQYVSTEEILQLVGDLTSSNLISTKKKNIEKRIKTNKYIDTVDIDKKLIPPTISITVTEHIPTAYIQFGETYYILDENLYIISAGGAETDLPCITGCGISEASEGDVLKFADEDEAENVGIFLSVIAEGDLEGTIVSIDFSDESNITFNYDNRITVTCGSAVEFESKLRLFVASVNSGELEDDAKGTMDLSTVGKATYLP